jgi:glycosyltransferase involved in cell wall biosynthesis
LNPCLLVPCYDHGDVIGPVLDGLAGHGLPCVVVDDGSGEPTRTALAREAERRDWLHVERRERNGGRGAALKTGYRWAAARGFSHVVQLDADGQHEARDVPRLLEAARARPGALVLGAPVFDESAPRSRRWGRQISRFWVWLETLSFAVTDPLCGFRCLPLAPVLRLVGAGGDVTGDDVTGDGMEFDPEIVVRLFWQGVPVVNVPTRVRYPRGGLSHFAPFADNVRMSWLHSRLFCGMVARAPGLLLRRGAPGSGT